MLKKLNLTIADVVCIILLLLALILVRLWQDVLFYDPFIAFFKSDSKVLPPYNSFYTFFSLMFRYGMNALISAGIIWFIFKDKSIIKLCAALYTALFLILITAFFIVLNTSNPNLLLLFYIRRFLIQPLFLILFIPAFYHQKKSQ